jgi:hypothetical protein
VTDFPICKDCDKPLEFGVFHWMENGKRIDLCAEHYQKEARKYARKVKRK